LGSFRLASLSLKTEIFDKLWTVHDLITLIKSNLKRWALESYLHRHKEDSANSIDFARTRPSHHSLIQSPDRASSCLSCFEPMDQPWRRSIIVQLMVGHMYAMVCHHLCLGYSDYIQLKETKRKERDGERERERQTDRVRDRDR
jgi:hypothetical protein